MAAEAPRTPCRPRKRSRARPARILLTSVKPFSVRKVYRRDFLTLMVKMPMIRGLHLPGVRPLMAERVPGSGLPE
jgi:hypothetical protein